MSLADPSTLGGRAAPYMPHPELTNRAGRLRSSTARSERSDDLALMEHDMTRLVLVLSLVACFRSAWAQSAGAQAEVLFRDGRELMSAGKYAEACAAFEQSQKLEPATTTLINLAGCREKLGQLASAWGLFLDAERQTRSATDAAGRQLHDLALARAGKLEPRVSKLVINIPDKSRVDGLTITRDNEPVEPVMWNRALPIDGGPHTIKARAPGANEWSTQVTVGTEGDTKTVDIPDLRNLSRDLTPAPAAKPVVSATESVSRISEPETEHQAEIVHGERSRVLPIAVTVGAVALVGAGGGMLLWGNSTYDDAKAEMMDQARRNDLYDSANLKRRIAIGLGVAGVATAGVAVWLFLRHDDSPATSTARIHHDVVVSPTGIAVLGTF